MTSPHARVYSLALTLATQTPFLKHCVLRRKAWPGPGPNIKFLSEVESVRSAVKELQRQNINKIIAVGHSGIEVDKQVATEVDGVDIVVGGHSNTFLYKGCKVKS